MTGKAVMLKAVQRSRKAKNYDIVIDIKCSADFKTIKEL